MAATISTLLDDARSEGGVGDSWQLDIELILSHVLNCSRTSLHANPQREIEGSEQEAFEQLLVRRRKGEPVAYLLRSKGFWDFDLFVDSSVLIPRPETELLVERALACLQNRENEALKVADIGTGSGAIGIAIARHSKQWQVIATDISKEALQVAKRNAQSLEVDNIEFRHGPWCEPLADETVDLLVSNPPYVAEGDPHLLEDGLPFEPQLALMAANNGLAAIEAIATQGLERLTKDGWVLFEHGYEQGQAIAAMLQEMGYTDICCWQDLAGLDRVTAARLNR